MSVHTKFQPIRSSRFAGNGKHIYECLVLLLRLAKVAGIPRGILFEKKWDFGEKY